MDVTRSLTHPLSRRLPAACLLLIGVFMSVPAASAQDDDPVTFGVSVSLCLEPGCTEFEDLTEPVDGVGVELVDSDTQQALGRCTTGDDAPGACSIDIPGGTASVTIILDESSIPDGYVTIENPGTADVVNTLQYPFLLMPEDGFPPDEEPEPTQDVGDDDSGDDSGDGQVSRLPETGSGGSQGEAGVIASGLVALASLLGLGAMAARQVMRRR